MAVTEDLCRPRSLGLFCFGCCTSIHASHGAVDADLTANTQRYQRNGGEWVWLRDHSWGTTAAGLCNLVVRLGTLADAPKLAEIGCPLHPARHGGEERRGADCLPSYECATKRSFSHWTPETQRQFVAFLKEGAEDSIAYSAQMDEGGWQRKFFALLQERGSPLPPAVGPSDQR